MSEVDPRVVESVEHVQKAALELIAAMRTALDVVEDFAKDPAALGQLLEGAATIGKMAVANFPSPSTPAADAYEPAEHFERITVDE